MSLFTGSGVAIVTPFHADGSIDYERFKKLIDWQIQEGTDAIVVAGTTGEASTLDDQEHIETVAFTTKYVNKRVPVIAGCGSNDTRHGVHLTQEIEKTGVDGVLQVTPYYNKCSQRGLIQHYTAIADAISIPMILYSVQGRTGVNINPETVEVLSKHPNIVGIKEASGNIAQVVEICRRVSPEFDVYSGNDDMVIPLMSVGGKGVISVVANIAPRETHTMAASYLSGDVKKAMELQLALKSLNDAMFVDVNPIPVKYALYLMGLIENAYRLPLCEPDEKAIQVISKALSEYGLI